MKHTKIATVHQWIEIVGPSKAVASLLLAGLSTSFADKLAHGRYGLNFRNGSIDKIRKAMAADGYSLHLDSKRAS